MPMQFQGSKLIRSSRAEFVRSPARFRSGPFIGFLARETSVTNMRTPCLLSQWLAFKLFGVTYFVGKKAKPLFHGPKWLSKPYKTHVSFTFLGVILSYDPYFWGLKTLNFPRFWGPKGNILLGCPWKLGSMVIGSVGYQTPLYLPHL